MFDDVVEVGFDVFEILIGLFELIGKVVVIFFD